MPNKEIIRVEIDDSEFSEFKKKFDAYEAAVKALPGEWQAAGAEIAAQKPHFEQMADSIRAQADELVNLASAQEKIGAVLEGTGIALAGMAKSGVHFSQSIFHATASLRHWTKLTALFGGLIGAGGLFGIASMAASVARRRSSAAGLGVTYGEQASFLTNFGRLPNAEGLLQGFSEAETNIGKKFALRNYLGGTESGDPARDFAAGLLRFKDLVDRTSKEMLGPALQQRGYNKLGIDTGTALAVKGMSRGEIEQISRGYGADLATRLGLSPEISKKWTEFTTKLEKAGEDIDTILWKGTSKLTKPLEDLSLGFEHLVSALFREGSPISEWVKRAGHGISKFADEIGSKPFLAGAAKLGSDVAAIARLLETIVATNPRGLAVLIGMGAAARFGGAAVAIGEALAGTALGAGAAAGAGAGAVGLGMNKLMPQHPERLRRGQEYENAGGSPTSPHPGMPRARQGDWQGPMQPDAQGPWQGPPMPPHPMPKGVFPKMAPAKPGSLSGKSAVEFESTNEPAPMGPGMGRYNFMHGQFGGPGQNLTRITTQGGHTVTVNRAAAPHFLGFINDLEKAGAPIHQSQLGGYNYRNIAGRHSLSQHAYGNAVDIDSTGRNIITPDFARWAREHDRELHAAESRWGIRAGRDMSNPDMGHWEWGGGAGSGGSARRAGFGHPHVGHHPANVSHAQHTTMIEDQSGGMVSVMGDSSSYGGGHTSGGNRPGAGERFRNAAAFYRSQPEHFRPMRGDVEDRRYEGGLRGGILPNVPDVAPSGHIAKRLSGPGKPLGAYRPSGLPPIEKSVDDYLGQLERVRNQRTLEESGDAPQS